MGRGGDACEVAAVKNQLHCKIIGDPTIQVSEEEKQLIEAINLVIAKYDLDKDDSLNEAEVMPFIANFAQKVIGMEPKQACTIEFKREMYTEMGGGLAQSTGEE